MKLPIVQVTLCSHLKNAKPGQLAEAKLRKTIGGTLHQCAADAWEAMVDAASKEQIVLKPTSSGDTYRTLGQQLAGFNQRYQLEPIEGQSTRTYEGKKWYLKKGMAPLAAPGTSKHNLGIAVDVANAKGHTLEWLVKNALEFGFSWEVVPEEPWHLRYVAGDNVPARVREHLDASGGNVA
jgi:hypothetical protein